MGFMKLAVVAKEQGAKGATGDGKQGDIKHAIFDALSKYLDLHKDELPELKPFLQTAANLEGPQLRDFITKGVSLRQIEGAAHDDVRSTALGCKLKASFATTGSDHVWLAIPVKFNQDYNLGSLRVDPDDKPKAIPEDTNLQRMDLNHVKAEAGDIARKLDLNDKSLGWNGKYEAKCHNKQCGIHVSFNVHPHNLKEKACELKFAAQALSVKDFKVSAKQALAAALSNTNAKKGARADALQPITHIIVSRTQDEAETPVYVIKRGPVGINDTAPTEIVDANTHKCVDYKDPPILDQSINRTGNPFAGPQTIENQQPLEDSKGD